MLLFALAACAPNVGPADTTPVTFTPGVTWAVPTPDAWPTDGWTTADPAAAGLDPAGLDALDAWAFADDHGTAMQTNALVIVKGGKLVHERYARGTTVDTPLLTWSVSKSFVNTLIGTAVLAGKLDVNAPAAKYLPAMDQPGLRDVRITDLLRMSSGMAWDESYETSPVFSSVIQMLYTRGHGDMAGFAASFGMAHAPGTNWSYSSGNSNVLMAALKSTMSAEDYANYPWTALFDPLGIHSATWEKDGSGTFVGSSYVYLTARDLAKWAYLYENDGVWEGKRLLPEGWVRYTSTLAPAFLTTPVSRELREDNPGAQWYVNVGDPTRDLAPPFPNAPKDLFGAIGHWGKRVWVLPSDDLVVVRMGDDRKHLCGPDEKDGCVADPQAVYDDHTLLDLVQKALVKP